VPIVAANELLHLFAQTRFMFAAPVGGIAQHDLHFRVQLGIPRIAQLAGGSEEFCIAAAVGRADGEIVLGAPGQQMMPAAVERDGIQTANLLYLWGLSSQAKISERIGAIEVQFNQRHDCPAAFRFCVQLFGVTTE